MAITIREFASLESVIVDLRNDQEPKDKLHYREIIMEAVGNPTLNPNGNAKLIQTLYKDILSKSSINFDKIPDSKGDITRYVHYDDLYKCLEILNKLLEGKNIEELDLTNKLHDMIITCRADFEFGYKFDIEFIKLTYESLVLTLHEVVNICIISYVDYLKDVKNKEYEFKTFKSKDLLIIKSLRSIISSYERGEWQIMMRSYKKNPNGFLGYATIGDAVVKASAAASAHPIIAASIGVVAAFIGALYAIRGLYYVLFNSSVKIKDFVTVQKEFIDLNIDQGNDSESAIAKQKKMSAALAGIAGTIEAKILKSDAAAKKELREDNKTNYSPKKLKEENVSKAFIANDIQLV